MVRAEIDRRLGAEIPRILAETALPPVTEDGHVTGLGRHPGPRRHDPLRRRASGPAT